jgi:hypothetical protein
MQLHEFHPRLTESHSSLSVFGIWQLGFFFCFVIATVTAEQVTGWRTLYTPTSTLLTGCADTVADFRLFTGSKIPVRGESSVSFKRWRRRGFGVEVPSDCFLSPWTRMFHPQLTESQSSLSVFGIWHLGVFFLLCHCHCYRGAGHRMEDIVHSNLRPAYWMCRYCGRLSFVHWIQDSSSR